MVAGIIALKGTADKAPAPAWLMWGYRLDLVEKHDRSRVAPAPVQLCRNSTGIHARLPLP
jgi:hypothetical protein